MTINSFEDLKAWQSCRDLRIWPKDLVSTLPREENFNLTGPVIRSVRSACANLAEGYGRNNSTDHGRCCTMANGSRYEPLNHRSDVEESGYIDAGQVQEGSVKTETATQLTRSYLRYLSSSHMLREPLSHYGLHLNSAHRTSNNP